MDMLWAWIMLVAAGGAASQPTSSVSRWVPRARLLLDAASEPLYLPASDLLTLRYPYAAYLEDEPEARPAEDPYATTKQLFLRNLILSQMYEDAVHRPDEDEYEDDTGYVYGERVDEPSLPLRRDDEVFQLESLRRAAGGGARPVWRDEKRHRVAAPTELPADSGTGQRESPLPVKRPAFQPSPYDSLKRLLQMQDKLDQEATETKTQRKRSYVPSEQSLVQQLGNLKKSA